MGTENAADRLPSSDLAQHQAAIASFISAVQCGVEPEELYSASSALRGGLEVSGVLGKEGPRFLRRRFLPCPRTTSSSSSLAGSTFS